MGPEATILLMQKVLAAVSAGDDADHVPLIVHQNPQVPSRIAALIDGDGEDPGPVLTRMAKDLHASGAQALAMPCNTAHYYAPSVEGATELPFLHMINLTATALGETGAHRIGMLASPATRKVGVFDAAFAANGLTPIWTSDEDSMLSLIRAVKAGQSKDQTGPLLTQQAQQLTDNGVDHLLIACTELSLLTSFLSDAIPWTNSLDCLTQAVVEFATLD